jgi:acyl carrier protein
MTIQEQIRDYIATNMLFSDNGYPYDDSTSFLEEGIVDSTGVLELILFVEETFSFKVPDEDVTPDNFDSVARLADYIQAKVAVPG